jgi:26S proteasome regulatory subunit N10
MIPLLCSLDNSEWMRNGDFAPNRVEAQHDAVSLLAGAKTNQSAESAVGIMTSSGKAPRVLVTPTNDVGKILACLHSIKIEGAANVLSSLRIAQLALKHRVHKNHKPRIVLFVGSPIEHTEAELVKLGAMLQKNECAVDIVNFGQIEENTPKLEAFVAAVNNNDNSHLVTIPPGPHVLSDLLLSSPIVSGSSAGDGAAGGGGNLDEFGVDPNFDPELHMAMQLSMEEARRAEEEAAKQASAAAATETEPAAAAANPTMDLEPEDAELQAALEFSMGMMAQDNAPPAEPAAPPAEPAAPEAPNTAPSNDVEMEAPPAAVEGAGADYDPYSDPTFVSDVLGELEGIDPNDPAIKAMMEGLSQNKDDPDKKE